MHRVGNICWKCEHWEECFKYRYGNKQQDYMKKIYKHKDMWGQDVIYVSKCDKYKYEDQINPKNPIPFIFMYTNFED